MMGQYLTGMKNFTIKNVSEFLDIVRNSGFPLCHRGQAQDWPLIPSIGRFETGMGMLSFEESLIERLQQYGYPFFKDNISSYSDWILHAQHYGLPTRLLDFTTNPLKGLYFAVEDESNTDGIVWSLDEFGMPAFPSFDSNEIVFYTPTHINPRIIAQESVFVVFPLKKDDDEVIPLEQREKDFRFFLKIKIPAEHKKAIKEELSILGIHKMSIYPGIEGVIEKIKEEWGITLKSKKYFL